MADERVEVQVEARCWCGSRATHNARLVDGVQVYDGKLFVIDDPNDDRVTYELRCRRHWLSGQAGPVTGQGEAPERSGSEAEPARQVV